MQDQFTASVLNRATLVVQSAADELKSFIDKRKKGVEVSLMVTALAKKIGNEHGASALFAYQIISSYIEMHPGLKVVKGRFGGVMTLEDYEKQQKAIAEKKSAMSASKFTSKVREMGYDEPTYLKAKAKFNGKPTFGQLTQYLLDNPMPPKVVDAGA